MKVHDVMAPPLRKHPQRPSPSSRTDEIIRRNVGLEQLSGELRTENRDLLEQVMELRNQLNHQDSIIDSLRKEVQQLTKVRKKPKRQASNYLKHKSES